MSLPHVPVLMSEVLEAFEGCTLTTFVDGTLGAGGHTKALLAAHAEISLAIGIDQDPSALHLASQFLTSWEKKTKLIHGNFENMPSILASLGIQHVDGILLDLGVSSMQLDLPEKGFSFMREGPLDMRMDPTSPLTAGEIINTWSEQELGRIFREYGEEKQWRAAARIIIAARDKKPILTTVALAEVLRPIFSWKKKGINPLTLVFQGLRISVNRELAVLEAILPQAINLLGPKGRLAVISFHSLEDRLVKNAFRFAASDKHDTSGWGGVFLDKKPLVKMVTRRPLCASDAEVAHNPRCRSAKLRVVEKL